MPHRNVPLEDEEKRMISGAMAPCQQCDAHHSLWLLVHCGEFDIGLLWETECLEIRAAGMVVHRHEVIALLVHCYGA